LHHKKSLSLVDSLSKQTYRLNHELNKYKDLYENLFDDVKIFMPNFDCYRNDR